MYRYENNILTIEDGAIIPEGVFRGKTDIHQIVFEGRADIAERAFWNCTGITQLTISEGVSIGDRAFYECTGITQLTIPKWVNIGPGAFAGCARIRKLIIPEGVIIHEQAFHSCTGITELTLSEGVSIGSYAFAGCIAITELTIPEGVSIGRSAFNYCHGITKLTLPEDMSVSHRPFTGCTGIKRIIMPALFRNVSEISAYFNGSNAQKRKAEFIRLPLIFSLPNFNLPKGQQSISGDPFKRHFTSLMALCFERLDVSTLPKLPIEMWWSILNQVYHTYLNERKTTFNLTLFTKEEKKSIEQYRVVSQSFLPCALNRKKIKQEIESKEEFLNMHLPESMRFMYG